MVDTWQEKPNQRIDKELDKEASGQRDPRAMLAPMHGKKEGSGEPTPSKPKTNQNRREIEPKPAISSKYGVVWRGGYQKNMFLKRLFFLKMTIFQGPS